MNVQEWVVETRTRRLFSSGSIKLAQSLVKPTEEVKFACVTNVAINPTLGLGVSRTDTDRGVMVLTNDRVVYASKRLWNEKVKYIRIPDIQSVDIQKGLFSCTLMIKGLAESFVVVDGKNLLMNLQSVLEKMVNEYRSIKETKNEPKIEEMQSTKTETKSAKEQLDELNELLSAGYITQEEFDQKKKQILGL